MAAPAGPAVAEQHHGRRKFDDRGGLAGENGDGMLQLRARDPQIGALRLRAGELGLRQGYVTSGSNAAIEPVDGQLQVLLVGLDRVSQNRLLHIVTHHDKVIRREQRLRAQPGILVVRRAHLRVVRRIFDGQAHAAPQIWFPTHGRR